MGDCVGGGCDTAQRLGCLAERRNPQKLQRGLKGFKIYVSRNENVCAFYTVLIRRINRFFFEVYREPLFKDMIGCLLF